MNGLIDGPRDGATFDMEDDGDRLNRQARDVFRVMSDGKAHTLYEIEDRTGHPQASISARLRDLRKPKYGGHTVVRAYLGQGLWTYALVVNDG